MLHDAWCSQAGRAANNSTAGMDGWWDVAFSFCRDPPVSEQQRYLELVEWSAGSMRELIHHLLDISQLEAGRYQLEAAVFNLADVVDDAVRLQADQAFRKGLELVYGLDPAIPSLLLGDPARLRQIIASLIENAVKFTDEGEVVLRAWVESREPSGVTLHIAVADTGVGVPADRADVIFQAFTQADGSLTHPHQGQGRGLAVCGELVGMMGGAIWLDNRQERGSTFHVTVHLEVPAAAGRGHPASLFPPTTDRPLNNPESDHPNRVLLMNVSEPQAAPELHAQPCQAAFEKSTFLARLDGDEVLAHEIIEMFLQESPKLRENVHRAAEQHDLSCLERAAHSLKGSVADMAAPQAYEAARAIEQSARQGKVEDLDEMLANLDGALNLLTDELHNVETPAA